MNNKNKKFSEASAQGRQQSSYASVAFMVAGTFAVVASLTMPYLAVCITLATAASIFLQSDVTVYIKQIQRLAMLKSIKLPVVLMLLNSLQGFRGCPQTNKFKENSSLS
ncbi:MAG: hypothetical protein LBU56_05270 [Rickettsiales bacterium]|nr:hypothetical protein [Rickettsiales bacterium]